MNTANVSKWEYQATLALRASMILHGEQQQQLQAHLQIIISSAPTFSRNLKQFKWEEANRLN